MSEKAAALDNLRSAYRELQAAIEGIPAERMTEVWSGEWSVKDMLAHMASWDEILAEDLRRIARGHMPVLASFREADVNAWNAFLMRPRRSFGLDQVRFESQHWHQQAIASFEALPDALFSPGNMAAAFAAIQAAHYRDHAGNILQWRQKEGI